MFVSRRRKKSGFTLPSIALPGFISDGMRGIFGGRWNQQRVIMYAGFGLIGVILIGFIGAVILFSWYSRDLPSPGKLAQRANSSTVFYDKNGKTIYEMYQDKNRVPVKFADISKYLKEGTVAVEDKSFYQHGGISQTGIIRAALSSIFKGDAQGGSTITQQLIKNVLLTSERSLPRKIKEAVLATEVEKRYTKDQILEMYLNEVPYGGTFYGVGAAAKGYFGKDPKSLTLVEAAIMAGLPQNPSNYSPFIGRKDAWKGRAKDVLRRMSEDGYITSKQYAQAIKDVDKYKFTAAKQAIDAPHFVFFVSRFVEKQFGAKALDQGLRIKTTLDLDSQVKLQQIVHDEVARLKDDYHLGNGAAVMLNSETGDILALVGSYDYNNNEYGKFDVATLGLRQPGSSLKPILYATAFEKKYTPASILMDVETEFGVPIDGQPPYKPVNYDGKFRGPVQMRFALANSLNIPAVKTLALVGLKDFLQKATDMGIESLNPTDENMKRFGLSAALGGGEVTLLDLTSAYSVFANGGEKTPLQFIEEIRDYNGKIIYKKPKANPKKVLSKEVSFLISHILSDDNARAEAFGRYSLLNIPNKTVAVKTGTTDSKRDNWAVGYTKDITLGVWVGNNDNSQLNNKVASGTTGASSIWSKAMKEMLKTYKDGIIDKPETVTAVQIDSFLGGLPKDGTPARSEYFIKGTEPTDVSPFYKKLKIHNGKLANEVQIKSGSFEEKDFYVFKEDDPVSGDGKNRWQEAIDKWASEQTDDKYKWPHDTSDESAEDLVVSISEPHNRSTVDTNDVHVKAKIISGGPKIKKVEINITGSEEKHKSWDGDTKQVDETFNLKDGVYKVQVVATNEKDKKVESTMEIGVKKPWDDKGSLPPPTATTAPTAVP